MQPGMMNARAGVLAGPSFRCPTPWWLGDDPLRRNGRSEGLPSLTLELAPEPDPPADQRNCCKGKPLDRIGQVRSL